MRSAVLIVCLMAISGHAMPQDRRFNFNSFFQNAVNNLNSLINNVTPAPGVSVPTLPPFSLPTLPSGGFSLPTLPSGGFSIPSLPSIPEGFSLPEGFTLPSLSGLVVPPLCADGVSYPQCPGACADGSDAVFSSDLVANPPCADNSIPQIWKCILPC